MKAKVISLPLLAAQRHRRIPAAIVCALAFAGAKAALAEEPAAVPPSAPAVPALVIALPAGSTEPVPAPAAVAPAPQPAPAPAQPPPPQPAAFATETPTSAPMAAPMPARTQVIPTVQPLVMAPVFAPGVAPAPPPLGRYRFTGKQFARLRQAGCSYSPTDQQTAVKLAALGFREEDFVAAYELFAREGAKNKVPFEWTARYAFLRLPEAELAKSREDESLTDYYNSRIGGRGLMVAGWIMTGVGAASLILGAVTFSGVKSCGTSSSGSIGGTVLGCALTAVFGAEFMAVGSGLIGAGVPMGVVGTLRVHQWLTGNVLDTATADELKHYRPEAAEGSGGDIAGPTVSDPSRVLPVARVSLASTSQGTSLGGFQFTF